MDDMHYIASTAETGHRIEIFVPENEDLPAMRISADASLAPASSSDMCINMDPKGGIFVCLRNPQNDNKWEKVRVSTEKLSEASKVLDSYIDDAYEKAVDAAQTSAVQIRLQEPYGPEITTLLYLIHGLDGCVSLEIGPDADMVSVEIQSNGEMQCEVTFSLKAIEALTTKYQCRPVLYNLAAKDIELNNRSTPRMQRLNLLAEAAFKARMEDRYLQLTGEMLSAEGSSDFDDVANPCLRDLLKSRKLDLFETRLKVYEAQRECLSKLKDSEQAGLEFRDEEGGVCNAQYRLNTLLKIFEDANLVASTLEKSLEKITSGNIFLEAFERAVERSSHVCDGQLQGQHQFTDCPLNQALLFLSTQPCFLAPTPKGIPWEEYAAEEHHDERWPLRGILRPLGGGGGGDAGPPEPLDDLALSKEVCAPHKGAN